MIKVESRNKAYILQKWNSIKFPGCEEVETSAALRSGGRELKETEQKNWKLVKSWITGCYIINLAA
jgi:hypothetical protein